MMAFEFIAPDLSDCPATETEKAMAAKYTRIRRVAVEGVPNAHTVWLQIGTQQFCIWDYVECKEDALWHCWILAKALVALLETETKGG